MANNRPELPVWAHVALIDGRTRQTQNEARNLWELLCEMYQAERPLPGAFAEVGVYRGGTARLLAVAAAALERPLHLFDTFAGTPPELVADDEHGWEGCHRASKEDVRRYLSAYPGVVWHVGEFGETCGGVAEPLCFVHVDCDIFAPTAAALAWAWQHLVPGGVIVVHDYGAPNCPGVTRAVDAHSARHGVPVHVLAGPGDNGQCMMEAPREEGTADAIRV